MENAFEILASRFNALLGTMEQRPKVVRDIVLTCVVFHNMLRTHQGGADRAPTPANDTVVLHKMNIWCMWLISNMRSLGGRPNISETLLKDYFNNVGTLAGQEDRI